MRIDKFLKVSRILKRRTVAQEACTEDKVLINGKPVLDGEKADYNALKSAGMAIPVTE